MAFKSEEIYKGQEKNQSTDAKSVVQPQDTSSSTQSAEQSAGSTVNDFSAGASSTVSDSVLEQQKAMENTFKDGLQTDLKSSSTGIGDGNIQNPVPAPEKGIDGINLTQQQEAQAKTIIPGQGVQLIDWSKPYSEIERNNQLQGMTPYDILQDFQKNGDGNYAAFMPWLSKYDPNKTIEQNNNDERKAANQAKWEQWGNLFQHLGNFFGTAIGAPSQKIESYDELTDRQRKLREGIDALRQKRYGDMLANIYKDRADKQAQLQAEANAKAAQARADYLGAQKNQVDALTPEKLKTEQAKQDASKAAAGLSTAKTKTEDETREGKKGLIKAQTNNANSSAADHAAGVAVKGAQVKHINSQTEGQNQKNSAGKASNDFNTQYVNNPRFKKYANQWAKNNGMAVGDNTTDGKGGTWANEKNRQQAYDWAMKQMKRDQTPPSRRPGTGGSNNIPPSRRGASKTPPSRRK